MDAIEMMHLYNDACLCMVNIHHLQGNDNYTGMAARDTANALQVLTNSVRGVAASTADRNLQDAIIDCARDVMDKSGNLIDEAKKAVNNPNNPDNQTRLAQVNCPDN